MASSSQLRLWSLPLLLAAILFLATPTLAQDDNSQEVEPDFGFYPQNAQSCLYDSSNSTNCDRPNYDVLNECLCTNTRNFVTNAARCMGEQGADNLDDIYNTFRDACDESQTPTNVERPEFMRAAENGASATTTGSDGPTSTGTAGPSSTTSSSSAETSATGDEDEGLSTGAHIGIGVGAAVFGALVMGGVGFWWFRRYRKRHAAEASPMLPGHGDDEAAHGTPMYTASTPGFTDSKSPHPPHTVSPPVYTGAWNTPYGGQQAPAELAPGGGGNEYNNGQAMEMEGSTHFNQAPVEMPGSTPGFSSERR